MNDKDYTMYTRYLPLIKSRAYRCCKKFSLSDIEDAMQEASVAFVSVVSKYDSAKGKFATLASVAIERHLNKWAQKQKRRDVVNNDWSIVGDDFAMCSDASFIMTDFMCSLDEEEFVLVGMCLNNWYKNKSAMIADAMNNGMKRARIEKISTSIRRKLVAT